MPERDTEPGPARRMPPERAAAERPATHRDPTGAAPGEPAVSTGSPRGAQAPEPAARATASGPGRVLIAVYAIFAIGSTSRASVQIATRFAEAAVPYSLSAFAAVVYVLATIALARTGTRWWRVAVASCAVEMTGVVAIGTASVLLPDAFPDATVWSNYGMGYLFIPLFLPALGLLWLRRTAPGTTTPDSATAGTTRTRR